MFQTLEGHTGTVNSIHSDSHYIMTSSADSTIKVWDMNHLTSSYKTLESHTDEVVSCTSFQVDMMLYY